MNNKSYIPLLLLTVFILGTPKSFALTQEEKDSANAVKQASKTAKIAESCNTISGKIEQRKLSIQKSISNLNTMVSKVEGIVNKRISALNEKGINTSEISANLATFKKNSQDIISTKQASLTSLNSLDKNSCQTDKKSFSASIKSFNESLKQQNSQQNSLKTYVRENIIAKIKAIGKTNE